MPINEADPCRTYVLLKLYGTGRKDSQISELKSLTDRRIVVINNRAIARKQKRAEYLLRCRSDSSIAVQHWAVLRTKAEQGLGRETLNHLKCYLTDICKAAVAEGYLHHNVSEGLKAPIALVKQSPSKAVVSMQQYVQAWKLLGERERLCFDLVMFAGMRESEVFALWCGDVRPDGLQIARSWYRGEYRARRNRLRASGRSAFQSPSWIVSSHGSTSFRSAGEKRLCFPLNKAQRADLARQRSH
jgi:site-specific recombinase XerC